MGQTGSTLLEHEGIKFFVEYSYSDDAAKDELPTIDTVYVNSAGPLHPLLEVQHVLSAAVLRELDRLLRDDIEEDAAYERSVKRAMEDA